MVWYSLSTDFILKRFILYKNYPLLLLLWYLSNHIIIGLAESVHLCTYKLKFPIVNLDEVYSTHTEGLKD